MVSGGAVVLCCILLVVVCVIGGVCYMFWLGCGLEGWLSVVLGVVLFGCIVVGSIASIFQLGFGPLC